MYMADFLGKKNFFLSPNSNIKDVEKYIILFYFILFYFFLFFPLILTF